MIRALRNMKVLAANQKLGYNLAEPGFSIVFSAIVEIGGLLTSRTASEKIIALKRELSIKLNFLRRARFGVQVTQEELECPASGLHMPVYQFCLLFYLRSN